MKRDYQRQKNNKYILPNAVYHTTLWQIRDYFRMKENAQDILDESPAPPDGMPRSGDIIDQVYIKAHRRAIYIDKIKVIDDAIKTIPEEYRKGIWNNIIRGDRYPADAERATYGHYKSKFILKVAEGLKLV